MASAPKRFSTEGSIKGLRAVEVLDEAVSLLRQAPLATYAIYYLGALPFCLGLIYFWFEMTSSAEAEAHLTEEALGLTALYFWMKTCQAVFARRLLALLEGTEEAWPLRRWANTALLQVIYAGSLLIIYPLAICVVIPFAWVHAFYHTISIVATGPGSTVRSSFQEAMEQARLWPRQNHLIMGVLLMATLVLFANLAVFFMMIPELLNAFFGIETIFDENNSAWNNSSFYLDVSVFCFLLLNPLNKAIYALRCFYGSARMNGADLKSALLRQCAVRGVQPLTRVVVLIFLVALLAMGAPARAASETSGHVDVGTQLDPSSEALDRSITTTLQKDDFAWRLPRAQVDKNESESWMAKAMKSLGHFLRKILDKPLKALAYFLRWLFERGNTRDLHNSSGPSIWASLANLPWRVIILSLAVGLLLLLAFGLLRYLRQQAPATTTALAPAAVRTVNLEAEDIRADDLPEDSWLALAQQMLERGEPRLALRAFYLATLSVLAGQQLVRLGPAKSNRDYLTELSRRLRGDRTLLGFFRENVDLFEASWYGTHAVTSAIIETMRANHQQMRSHAVA